MSTQSLPIQRSPDIMGGTSGDWPVERYSATPNYSMSARAPTKCGEC